MVTTGAEQQKKKKKPKRKLSTPYSTMTIREAEQHLQLRIDELQEVPIHMILEKPSIEGLDMNEIKEKVYWRILEYSRTSILAYSMHNLPISIEHAAQIWDYG